MYVKFLTLGCRLNQYETQAVREQFLDAGYLETSTSEVADILVLNSCTVTAQSDKESRYLIRKFHRQNPNAKIVVTGCYVEKNESEINRIPGVSLTVLNRQKDQLRDLFESSCVSGATRSTVLPAKRTYTPLSVKGFEGRTRAHLKIQDGCNHACSFCKVVLVRGPSRSREPKDVVEEAKRLAAEGYLEIVLTGVQLGAYGLDLTHRRKALPDLLQTLLEETPLKRIRLSSIEPTDVTDDLIEVIKQNKRVCPQLHIPLQSGDSDVLKLMNRRYDTSFFITLVKKLKREIEDFVLTTDVMVGFPGETHEAFSQTIHVLEQTRPYKLHIFPYSAREQTRAYMLPGPVKSEEMRRRRDALFFLETKLKAQVQRQFLGKKLEVLVEDLDPHTRDASGRSGHYLQVKIPQSGVQPGQLCEVVTDRIEHGMLVAKSDIYETRPSATQLVNIGGK